MDSYPTISSAAYLMMFVVAIEVALLLAVVLWKMLRNEIDLTHLICEPGPDGKASLSRFQFLVFTFVIAGLYLLLCIENGQLIEVPNSALLLLGISTSGYLVSKSMAPKPVQTKTTEVHTQTSDVVSTAAVKTKE